MLLESVPLLVDAVLARRRKVIAAKVGLLPSV
jgi:hypothetical protein